MVGGSQAPSGGSRYLVDDIGCGCGIPDPISGPGVPVGSPQHFFPRTNDDNHYRWQDRDPSTPDVTDIYYDFRSQGSYSNLITPQQIAAAEVALSMWETAAGGRIHFLQNTTAPAADIINIGTGNLAALGGASGQRQTLALGGATFNDGAVRTITAGTVWMDMAESWDVVVGNGNPTGTYDFASVTAHEIGHALGMGHTDDVTGRDLMDGVYSVEFTAASAADAALIVMVYGCTGGSGSPGGGGGTQPLCRAFIS